MFRTPNVGREAGPLISWLLRNILLGSSNPVVDRLLGRRGLRLLKQGETNVALGRRLLGTRGWVEAAEAGSMGLGSLGGMVEPLGSWQN